tara:strand:+ start:198 stop:875 length:678 start_codon:yes stop_codon:yes gene_type:complete
MPRKAPKEVIEHRISLSNFERDLLTKSLKRNEENRLYVAGINQIGQIAGSSVLLYGLMAYFGYSLFDTTKNAVREWIDNTSSDLADFAGGILNPRIYTTDESNAIRNAFDRIDEAIVYEREQLRLNDVAGQSLINQLRAGDIDYQTFRAEMYAVTTRNDELEQLTKDIAFARGQVKAYQALRNAGSIETFPQWFTIDDWRALLLASYDGAYNPAGEVIERPEITY